MRRYLVLCIVVLFVASTPMSVLADSENIAFMSRMKKEVISPSDQHGDAKGRLFDPIDLRRLAPIQVVVPSGESDVWQLMGSPDGKRWRTMGAFELEHGEVPIAGLSVPEGQIPFSMVSGNLKLENGNTVQGVVASVADVGSGGPLPAGSLTFVVHDIAVDPGEVAPLLARLAREAQVVPGVEVLGVQPGTETQESEPFQRITGEVNSCPGACQAAFDLKIQVCNSSYVTCVAAATAAFSLCLVLCSPTGPGCTVCAVLYGAALAVCDQNVQGCRAVARADKTACDIGCPIVPEEPVCDGPDPICTPLVINLDGRQNFRFSSADDGVWFDLDGNGSLQKTAWTEAGYEQAFLVLDRNGNGFIDDGLELFGGVTAQPSSDSPNGFRALAVFDDPMAGGNGDGLISQDDSVFDHLRLWFDENQDGLSQVTEIRGLAEEGIVSIDTNYLVSNRRDRHGNVLRYRSNVRLVNRATQCVDVFFVQAESN